MTGINSKFRIDDIEDNSKMRRGVPGMLFSFPPLLPLPFFRDIWPTPLHVTHVSSVAHAIYGIPSTINCANYVYFLAMDHCRKLGNPEALEIFLGKGSPSQSDFIFRVTNRIDTNPLANYFFSFF